MAGKRPRIAELYRTRGDSLPAVDITRANFRAGAVPDSQGTRCPDEWPRGGRTGSYPSCTGSEQLGDRGAERCGRALGNEANVVGLQDEEASYNSTCRGPTETKRQRRGWRRLGFPSRHSTGGSESDGNPSEICHVKFENHRAPSIQNFNRQNDLHGLFSLRVSFASLASHLRWRST